MKCLTGRLSRCRARGAWLGIWAISAIPLHPKLLSADPVAVRYMEGSEHGYLVLRTLEGKIVAAGDLIQTVHGDRVTSHLVFHFKDGSVDDETAVFSQREKSRLIDDRHIQKGPAFPHPTDVSINASTGQVTVRYPENGQEKVDIEHVDCPADLANSILLDVLTNIRAEATETKLSYVAATPKPRLVKLSISPRGRTRLLRYVIKRRASL